MIGHGYGKVFHGGLAQHVARVSSLGLPGWWAYLSAFTEFFGGMLLIAGFLTRFVSLAVMIDMAVAMWKIHWKNGMFGKGGYELSPDTGHYCLCLDFLRGWPHRH